MPHATGVDFEAAVRSAPRALPEVSAVQRHRFSAVPTFYSSIFREML